ncbi:FAM83 family protein [Candidatus Babeliales bacterium]|nr:FAM83 family protein [Candidatus Babeliales bacterium]MCF7899502.1 FAM83 family protein [Candidatus Babeliales bacterium]
MKKNNIFKKKFFLLIFLINFNYSFLSPKSFALFSPKDKISEKLIDQINNTKNKIYGAIFIFTDSEIAKALVSAKKDRNVDVQIVTDKSCIQSESNKISFLKDNGIDVFVFKDKNNKNSRKNFRDAIMHNKFAVFDDKVWTGSFNWTVSANKRNRENVLCTTNQQVYKKYEIEFENLKRECNRLPIYQENKIQEHKKINNIQKKEDSLKNKVFSLLKKVRDSFI